MQEETAACVRLDVIATEIACSMATPFLVSACVSHVLFGGNMIQNVVVEIEAQGLGWKDLERGPLTPDSTTFQVFQENLCIQQTWTA